MTFKTLENISKQTILDVFNHSFADYLIPFHLELEQLTAKMIIENIQLSFSVGAFEHEKLVGFILHGLDSKHKIVYNGGTGVIPEFRGAGLTKQMYAFILPTLRQEQIKQLVLEVISNNTPAIKSYENIGYHIDRQLNCYSGHVKTRAVNTDLEIKKIIDVDWESLQSMWNVRPAWQYSIDAMKRSKSAVIILGAYVKAELIGYAIVNSKNGRICQLAVSKKHRRKKVATSLVNHIATQFDGKVSMINVDSNSPALASFLEGLGLTQTLIQYEMKMELD